MLYIMVLYISMLYVARQSCGQVERAVTSQPCDLGAEQLPEDRDQPARPVAKYAMQRATYNVTFSM